MQADGEIGYVSFSQIPSAMRCPLRTRLTVGTPTPVRLGDVCPLRWVVMRRSKVLILTRSYSILEQDTRRAPVLMRERARPCQAARRS